MAEIDPLELWRVYVFVSAILLSIYRAQTVVFSKPGGNEVDSKL
jgi:hypothetical protein